MRGLALLLPLLLPAAQDRPLRDRIDALVRGLPLKDARVGVLVFSIKANEAIYAANERDPFLMASNTKLLTTAAALGRLGPDFRFRTLVGTVDRDLHVFAGGDPNISGRFHDDDPTAIFKKWAERIRAAGVARIEDLVLHTGIFDADRVNPGWKKYEAGPWWSAPFAALSLNDNCVDLKVEPGPEGEPCKVTLAPDTAYVTLVNRTQTVAKPAQPLRISRPEGANVITLRGEVGLKDKPSTHWVSVHEPVMYFGTVLRETLAKAGIEVAGGIEESPRPREEQKDFRELASWESDLAATIAVCNGPSQNFYAEMILRTLGWKGKGKGTLENGLAVAREFLQREAKLEKIAQADGSGLTRENAASPADLVKLLLYMRTHTHAREFRESLPANGAPKGTLRNRMTAADVRGRVRAKTGHIGGVSCLSGYAESLGGDTYVFSILVNADLSGPIPAADRLQDQLCELLVRFKGD